MEKIGERLSLSMYEAVREIKDRVSCFDVAHYLGVDVDRGYTRCESEKTPSCHLERNKFHCFSCGKWGDVIDYYCHETGVSTKTAIKEMDRATLNT